MSIKRKVAGVFLTSIIAMSSLSTVFAAETDKDNELLIKQENQRNIQNIEDVFNKKSFKMTEEDYKRNQELKDKITPPEKLGEKGQGNEQRGFVSPGWRPGDEFGDPSGTNNISFASFDYGDMILVHDGTVPWGYYRHAGMWDSDFYNGSLSDKSIWEASPDLTNDVHRATPTKFRNYDYAVGLWVPNATADERYDTTWFALDQSGDPYDASSSKTNYDEWYCSKLLWAAYKEKAGIDLDSNGGLTVLPDNIYMSQEASIFATGD